jgi:hypothetical protein
VSSAQSPQKGPFKKVSYKSAVVGVGCSLNAEQNVGDGGVTCKKEKEKERPSIMYLFAPVLSNMRLIRRAFFSLRGNWWKCH